MKKSITIIGGGPTALITACFLDTNKFNITIYEKNKTLGRKFLVAGKGGFNLTHSEPIDQFIERYTPTNFLKEALQNFDNKDLQKWLAEIGIQTFVGSSKRVYPEKKIKPIEVLNSIINVLNKKGVKIEYNKTWTGWNNDNHLLFKTDSIVKSDFVIFALGGASWKVTGSNQIWLDIFKEKEIETKPFQASNCAYKINWKEPFIKKFEGNPLKNIAIKCKGKTLKSEVVITHFGLEGNAIYALSPQIRDELNSAEKSTIYLDLKPTLSVENIQYKIQNSVQKNTTEILKNDLKLSTPQIGLLKNYVLKDEFLNSELLVQNLKNLPIKIKGFAPLDEAISTVGGISLNAVDKHFQLKKLKNQYCIGEMLDYDAPTGGYLLQSCFSMGVHLAKYLNSEN